MRPKDYVNRLPPAEILFDSQPPGTGYSPALNPGDEKAWTETPLESGNLLVKETPGLSVGRPGVIPDAKR